MKIETGFQARDIRKKQEFRVAFVHFAMFTRVMSRVRRTTLPGSKLEIDRGYLRRKIKLRS